MTANSGRPADTDEITLSFQRASVATSADFDNLLVDIQAFFNSTFVGQHHPISDYLSYDRDYVASHCKVDFYHRPVTAGPILSPVATRSWTLSAPAAGKQSLPDQVAVVNSFHADLSGVPTSDGTTRPQARRRGRFYLGPLNTLALQGVAGAVAAQVVSSDLMNDLVGSSRAWLLNAPAANGWVWEVWSKTDWAGHPVVGGFVDDRFDTQRRRLEVADSRLRWP
jgi:hypothetical protein